MVSGQKIVEEDVFQWRTQEFFRGEGLLRYEFFSGGSTF
jgi:hypothetical protein